jgi:NifU-like protein involved in Fe-S cluster formation
MTASDTDNQPDVVKLYSKQIVDLSGNIPHTQRLDAPDATVTKRSPLCGSSITVDITMADDKVSAFGQNVMACALGKATAAIIAENIIGRSYEELVQTRDHLRAMLKEQTPITSELFPDLEVLQAAQNYPNRHASVMLILDATTEAIEKIHASKTTS